MEWYYAKDRKQVGPFTEGEFSDLIGKGEITASTLVWNADLTDWKPFSAVRDRYPQFKAAPPALAAADLTNCSECGRPHPQTEMIQYENIWVCADCKPRFAQKIKEGVQPQGLLTYAGFWIRFGAKMIDGIILWFVYLLVGFLAGIALDFSDQPEAAIASSLIMSFFQLLINAAYITFFLGRYSATPGKMACGLTVVQPDRRPISYPRALGRFFAELLSSIILCIGYIMAAFDSEKRALHDRICNTRVIRS